MPLITTEKAQKLHESYYVLLPKKVKEFYGIEKGDLVLVNWKGKV